MPRSPRRWTSEEDRVLLDNTKQLFSNGSTNDTTFNWVTVASALPGRSNKDCRKRWSKMTGANKGTWSLSEDGRLVEGVQKYGHQWAMVAKTVETRSSDQCAKRWQHCLDPSLDRSEWTCDQDARLVAAVRCYGTNWKDIRKCEFPERSTTNLKNRHIALIRQSSKAPSVYPSTAETLDQDIDRWAIEQGILEDMSVDAVEDINDAKKDQSSGSYTSAFTTPFENTLGVSASGCLATDTMTTANCDPHQYPLKWTSPSQADLVQSQTSIYPTLDDLLGPTYDLDPKIESSLGRDDDCESFMTESFTQMPAQFEGIHASQTSNGIKSSEPSCQGAGREQLAASNLSSRSRMTIAIDNPDPHTMTSILEILAKAGSKVTISMNS